jgi:hypothetical protein
MRSDSAAAAVQAAQNAALGPLEPPAHVALRDCDRPYWHAIMTARARHLWTEIDLAHAATLARCMADVERLTREVQIEGDVIGERLNPKHKLIETLSRRAVLLARLLHVHPEATIGRSRDEVKSRENQQRAIIAHDDDLIPSLGAMQ